MIDEELEVDDTPDEWQELADKCSAILTEHGIAHNLLEEGILDTIDPQSRELFQNYKQFVPVYSLVLESDPALQLSICVARLPDIRRASKYGLPVIEAYAPHFYEVNESVMLEIGDARLFGVVEMSRDPGFVYIQPHNTGSMVAMVADDMVLDIEGYDQFRKKYQFDCEDQELVSSTFTPNFLSIVASLGDPYLEINEGILIVGYKTPFEESQVEKLCEFLKSFPEAVNK
jgi:hypothetical protein